jgi:hypothetical protein
LIATKVRATGLSSGSAAAMMSFYHTALNLCHRLGHEIPGSADREIRSLIMGSRETLLNFRRLLTSLWARLAVGSQSTR